MLRNEVVPMTKVMLLAGFLAGAMLVSTAFAQSGGVTKTVTATVANKSSRYRPDRFAGRAGKYYALVWGIDSVGVKAVESGEMIRFSYHVLDANKAKTLNDKKLEPSLIDERAHVKLVVPSMENVGALRQSAAPEAGKVYWVLFSNKGGYVKRGDQVNVVIGQFRAQGLVVD
jgi:hypothetical protein